MPDMVLVVSELADGTPKKITYEMLTIARQVADELEYDVGVAVLGEDLATDALASEVGARGADTVFALEEPTLATYNSESYAAALSRLIQDRAPALVLFGMTPVGRELAPLVAAKLSAGLASDIVGLEVKQGQFRFTRPIYSNQVLATVEVRETPALVTVRPNTWAPAESEEGQPASIDVIDVGELPAPRREVLSVQEQGGERPELTDAGIIVSGGRGVGSPEDFALIEQLADLLGAAVGTTRAVVDAGWRPYEEQVGQTGKTVSPKLYFAIGISGAIQHISGMRTSQYIVAINKDPDAPIFKIADYGVVADLFDVVPELIEEIEMLQDQS